MKHSHARRRRAVNRPTRRFCSSQASSPRWSSRSRSWRLAKETTREAWSRLSLRPGDSIAGVMCRLAIPCVRSQDRRECVAWWRHSCLFGSRLVLRDLGGNSAATHVHPTVELRTIGNDHLNGAEVANYLGGWSELDSLTGRDGTL